MLKNRWLHPRPLSNYHNLWPQVFVHGQRPWLYLCRMHAVMRGRFDRGPSAEKRCKALTAKPPFPFIVTGTALAYLLQAMKIKCLPAGFVIPAQPVVASKPPSGADWVHEIKHDGYRLIVRRDGAAVRLYTRNAVDLTARLPAIAAAAERIKATSFTIDGEAVVLGPDGLSRFDELRRRAAAQTAILYAFDLIEHDGEDLHDRPFLERKAELARLLRDTKAGILLNEHIAEDGAAVFAHACRLGVLFCQVGRGGRLS
jgi:bifunctional non-homologous end joining protein LigD